MRLLPFLNQRSENRPYLSPRQLHFRAKEWGLNWIKRLTQPEIAYQAPIYYALLPSILALLSEISWREEKIFMIRIWLRRKRMGEGKKNCITAFDPSISCLLSGLSFFFEERERKFGAKMLTCQSHFCPDFLSSSSPSRFPFWHREKRII